MSQSTKIFLWHIDKLFFIYNVKNKLIKTLYILQKKLQI